MLWNFSIGPCIPLNHLQALITSPPLALYACPKLPAFHTPIWRGADRHALGRRPTSSVALLHLSPCPTPFHSFRLLLNLKTYLPTLLPTQTRPGLIFLVTTDILLPGHPPSPLKQSLLPSGPLCRSLCLPVYHHQPTPSRLVHR